MSLFSWLFIFGILLSGSKAPEAAVPVAVQISIPETPTPLLTTEQAVVDAPELSFLETIEELAVPATPVTETEPQTDPSIETKLVAPTPEPVVPQIAAAENAAPETDQEPDLANLAMEKVRSALVNILCTSNNPRIQPASGSGVFIDDRGIILTAAHIGQYFLLAEAESAPVSCVIRSGSPARTKYLAKPLYISKSWITKNPTVLLEQRATGTGEHDFALLTVTESATATPLPLSFKALSFSRKSTGISSPVIIGSYGAQFISSTEVVSSLFPTLLEGSVKDVYTFGRNTIDVLALGGSEAAQLGSSGGPIADADGNLAGLITTSTIDGPIHERNVSAITLRHIRSSFAADTRADLDSFLMAGDPEALRTSLLSDMVELRTTLMQVLGI